MERTTAGTRSTLWAASCARSGLAKLRMGIPQRPKTIQTLASVNITIVEISLVSQTSGALLPTQKCDGTIVNLCLSIQESRL